MSGKWNGSDSFTRASAGDRIHIPRFCGARFSQPKTEELSANLGVTRALRRTGKRCTASPRPRSGRSTHALRFMVPMRVKMKSKLSMNVARLDGGVIEVAAGLVFRGGQLLITQRRPGDHLAGFWEFPGGKRQAHETFEECLGRELREELGIETEAKELLESITHHYPEKSVLLKFFRCVWRRHEPQALGCQAWAWIKRTELDQFQFPPADAKLLDLLRKRSDLWE